MLCYTVRNDRLPDTRPHLHCTEKNEGITQTLSILISHKRIGLKYETPVHSSLRKAESEKCFWNNLLLHQQSSIIPDIIDVGFLLMKTQKHVQLNNCHEQIFQGTEIRCPQEKILCSVFLFFFFLSVNLIKHH